MTMRPLYSQHPPTRIQILKSQDVTLAGELTQADRIVRFWKLGF